MKWRIFMKSKISVILIQLVLGGCMGLLLGYYLIQIDVRMGWSIPVFIYIAIFGLISYILQIALHEAGHCIFGLFTGYRFVSYRIGSYMWVKENDKIVFRRYRLKGTAGQCLMEPPKSENQPYFLYNLGGGLVNLMLALLFFLLTLLIKDHLFYIFASMMIVIGLLSGVSNLIPMDLGVPNDGYNILCIYREPKSVHSLYQQLILSKEYAEGKRTLDLDESLLELYEGADLTNPLNTCIAANKANRLIILKKYEEAEKLLKELESLSISDIYKNSVTIDLISLLLIMDASQSEIEHYFQGKVKKTAEKNKTDVSSLLMMYGIDLLVNHDDEKALIDLKYYEDAKKNYPYQGLIKDLDEMKHLFDERNETK